MCTVPSVPVPRTITLVSSKKEKEFIAGVVEAIPWLRL
jgi:hypothetical protein